MKDYAVMIKPASSLCNMRCRYCFYADEARKRALASYGVMSLKTQEAVLRRLRESLRPGDRLTLAFQGGEPCVAGLDWFQHLTEITDGWRDIRLSLAFQTNGILLNEAWCGFLKAHHALVGLSLDCMPAQHDRARVDGAGNGTYKAVLSAMRLMKKHRVDFNILCTLTAPIAAHPQQVWAEMEKQEMKYVQFTPCLAELNQQEPNPWALTPEGYASFYRYIFDRWLERYRQGRYISIKLFDDLVNLLAFGQPTACGINGRCQPQLIIEADGSAYPCDFYCLDQYLLGNLREDSLNTLLERSRLSPAKAPEKLQALCESCPHLRYCAGGCKRMRQNVCVSSDQGFCGQKELLDHILPALIPIIRRERALSSGNF